MLDPKKPYYDLPKLPPGSSIESLELYKELLPASEAVAKLSAIVEHLPNQKALYQSVILLEAKASSELEQIITTDENFFILNLIWFSRCVREAANRSIDRANRVREAMQKLKTEIRGLDSRMYSQDLINTLFLSPVVFAEMLIQRSVVGSLSTAHLHLKKLESAGLLKKSDRKYHRKVGYFNLRLIEAL